jgi:hypothetical protein
MTHLNRSEFLFMSITWSFYNHLRSWSLYDLWKVQYSCWSDCTKRRAKREHNDYGSHQQIQKETMNQKRQQSYDFKKEDKIWLNLKNIHTDHLCKKFNAKNDKYTIVKKINSHSFCLNTLSVFITCFTLLCFNQQSWTLFLLSVQQTHNPHHKL